MKVIMDKLNIEFDTNNWWIAKTVNEFKWILP